MSNSELIYIANKFFKDYQLTLTWLDSPCRSFAGKTPSEHFFACEQGRKEVMGYLETLICASLEHQD